MSAVTTATPQITLFWRKVLYRISSLLKNPESGGMPAIASVPMSIVQKVTGRCFFRPPMCRMSCWPAIAWITEPEQRKSRALKKACVMRWNAPAAYAPTPMARNMKPSCDTVEYASTRLMSFCTRPIVAATNAVATPTTATISIVIGEWPKSTALRPTMYTPAVTIVAAWIRAETGVGPSIASGSQTYSGICADLPVAPTNSSSVIRDSVPNPALSIGIVPAAFATARKSRVPNVEKMRNIPMMKPQSPMRLTMKAFLPASDALFFSYQ